MPTLTESLRTLHRIHRQHSDLKDRLTRGPRQIQAAEANVKKCEADLAQAKDAFKQAKMASDEKQLQLKHRESKLVDLQAKLNMAQSNKEYQLLKDQMAADKQANSVLADEILETLEKRLLAHADAYNTRKALAFVSDYSFHLNVRANLPQRRLNRLPRILRELLTRRYHEYANGFKSAAKDLVS